MASSTDGMSTPPATDAPAAGRRRFDQIRAALAAIGATILGAAPHVLHHAGPVAGAAVLAGTTGRLLFGAVGFLLLIPLLRRLHRRSGSWVAPAGVAVLMAAAFTFSSLVIGPALTSGDDEAGAPVTGPTPAAAPGAGSPDHEAHHP